MRKIFRYRIYLTKGQKRLLEQMLEQCRWVYNEALILRRNAWEERQENIPLYETMNWLTEWKQSRPQLQSVHSQVLQNALMRVDMVFGHYLSRVQNGKKAGLPRFKPANRYDSLTYPQYGNGVRLEDDRLILSKVGAVKVVLHRPVDGSIVSVTVYRSATGKWHALLMMDCAVRPLPPEELAVGVDVGIKSLATLSTGEHVPNPHFLKQERRALYKAERRFFGTLPSDPRQKKYRRVVARIHERIVNRRRDYAHKEALKIVRRAGIVVVEKIAVRPMIERRPYLADALSDVALYRFTHILMYKAAEAGRQVVCVNPRGTSQQCSRCGAMSPKDLSMRFHSCKRCGLFMDRDENAALNILALGLQSLGVAPKSSRLGRGNSH